MADPEVVRNEEEQDTSSISPQAPETPSEVVHDPESAPIPDHEHPPVNGQSPTQAEVDESAAQPGQVEDVKAQETDVQQTPIEDRPQVSTPVTPATPNGDRRPTPSREESNQSSEIPVRSSRQTSLSQTIDTGRRRTDSASTSATTATTRSAPRTSMVFVQAALETIANSKDARKKKPLLDASQKALSLIKGQGDLSQTPPEIIFLPLQLATEASTISIVTTALDCIGKLISYSYFAVSGDIPSEEQKAPLIERAIDTICDCFQGEATPNEVQMQIIKSLLSAILNDKIVVHGAGLLKSVRQIYNIFLLSKSSPNQQIAQGTLTQMVGTVFERVKARLASKSARFNSSKSSLNSGPYADPTMSPDTPLTAHPDMENRPSTSGAPSEADDDGASVTDAGDEEPQSTKMTLQTFETRKSFDDARIADNAPTMITRVRRQRASTRSVSGPEIPAITIGDSEESTEEDEEDEIYIKDAFLVFRAMCKLSTKALTVEDAVDVRSQGMRSKLLSLHIIQNVLHNHPIIFTSPYATIRSSNNNDPTSFTQAIKQYLCLSLSRNGSSSNNRVFEVSAEIFLLMVQHLRVMLKREIEVFLKEIYLAVLDKRSAPPFQKQYIIYVFSRLVKDAKALVEIYLNYDCDRAALDNMYQRIIEHISRLASSPVTFSAEQEHLYFDTLSQYRNGPSEWQNKSVLPQSLSSATITSAPDLDRGIPTDYMLKQESLECLVESLRSMVSWSQQGIAYTAATMANGGLRNSTDEIRDSIDTRDNGGTSASSPLPLSAESGPPISPATPIAEDDPAELERVKQHKTALNNAVRQFNYKPKRGIKSLVQGGFIASNSPQDIARFMFTNEKIGKKALGEFLGEGDAENIAIMHAFVDQMEFAKTRFVDALRKFLQSFRLPGEAQKIDRLMLKFAERYTSGNPNAFANADTAYVLGYSVIMLNTDQHSSNVKKKMTPEDFIKNNRGINDNADLPEEYLKGIFEEIASNEIVLNTERETAANLGLLPQPSAGFAAGLGQALATVGRDLQREAYNQASEEMANKTEALFKNLLRAQKKGSSKSHTSRFIPAQSFRHVGPMFEVVWMSYLTSLSGHVQETNNIEAIKLCMEGLKLAVRITCLFDLQDPRQAFISSLTRFTNLYNLSEMKAKNLEALKTLLDTAYIEGNLLRESWRDVLTAISQLDRFQLISGGVRENEVPDVMRRQAPQTPSSARRGAARRPGRTESGFHADIAEESRSADMIRSVDRIFTNTEHLSGEAIVHFVRALTQVSWQEIQSSGQSESPRTYSLQKIVEVSGYNMTRVRFEWTNIWHVLGDHFVQVGCHNNTSVVYFAMNSLRQLSMQFMQIEELPGFKFQKDFLKPFEHILSNATQVPVKDMVLRCLIQMIQARGDNIRSGWRTMFGVFTTAAKEPYEAIVNLAFDNVTSVYNDRFGIVISQGAFADLIVCLTEFSKNGKFQKKSLQAIETLKATVPKMLRTPECPLSQKPDISKDHTTSDAVPKQPTRQTSEEQFWFPVLFAYHDVLMTGEDLEVRSRALTYLFETLTRYGRDFPRDFWDILWRQLLYPIFMVLKSKSEMSKALNHEELSVWLSTTMIQALRNMITLYTHFFDSLEYMLDRFLDLLALCICQENDTLARIGSNCLQQLILQNVTRFNQAHWEKIVGAFVELFNRTEATALFSAATSAHYRKESASSNNAPTSPPADLTNGEAGKASETKENGTADLQLEPKTNGNTPDRSHLDVGNASADPSRASSVSSYQRPPSQHRNEPDLELFHPETTQQAPVVVTAARRRFFNQIITKCVLQLLMIETVSELFSNDAVYASIPSHELLRLMALLKKSYHFAKRFNEDRELRSRLFREGFMRQPPNLLKQESGSASVYVSILLRMYNDEGEERKASRGETEKALIPLCADILSSYIELDEETQQRNIVTWRPVVVDVLEGCTAFDDQEFDRNLETFAPLAVGLMGKDMGPELQRAVQGLWAKVTEVKIGVKVPDNGRYLMSPVKAGFGRRGSKASRS